METSKVYYTDLRTSPTSNLLDKMERLVKRAGIEQLPLKDSFVAIKIHFGEPGNLAYLRPNYAARMANLLRNNGAKPFLTDCNTHIQAVVPMPSITCKAQWKTVIILYPPNARSSSEMD